MTAATVFPHLEQFRDWIVAGNSEIKFDQAYMVTGYSAYTELNNGIFGDVVYESLKPEAIFSQYVGDRNCILEKDTDTPILTDTNPWLEYYYFSPPSRRPIRCD